MEWVPTANDEIASEPDPVVSGAVPREVAPSKNSTEPVGVPAPGAVAVTVALKVVLCPKTEGFTEELTDDVVAALFTT